MAETHMENVEELEYGSSQMYRVTCWLNLRQGPSLESPVISILNPGTEIEVENIDGDWAQTISGYVMKKFLEII